MLAHPILINRPIVRTPVATRLCRPSDTVRELLARPRIYLKKTCPYCLKLRIFLTEAGLADQFDFTVFIDGDETHKALRARMQAAGQEPSFPAVEIGQGNLLTGTDDLIQRFARQAGIDAATLPLLAYYSEGVFGRHVAMFQELRQLKGG